MYDIIILGSIGPVFGDYYSTTLKVSKSLNRNGIVILDDGYIEPGSDYSHPQIQKKDIVIQKTNNAGMSLIDEVIIQKNDIKSSDDHIYDKIKIRCNELIEEFPDKKYLFEDYIKKQEEENDVIENKIVCSTMVTGRK